MLFYTCPKPPIKYKHRLSTCKRTQHYWMLHVAYLSTPCCMLLGVVAQSFKPFKLLSQRLPTFLLLRDLRSAAQQCWIRCTDLRTLLGPRTHITPGIESLMDYSSHDVLQVPTLLGGPFMRFKIMTFSILLGLKVCVRLNNTQ